MSLFGKAKPKEKKQDEKKPAAVKGGKKAEAKKSMKDLYGTGSKEKTVAAASSTKPDEVKPAVKKDSSVSAAYRVLLRPLATEKGSHLGAENKYLFEVGYDANKIEIAKAVEAAFGIKPTKVNVIKLAGKIVRRGRTAGRRKNWKKAIVTLPAGKTIQIYEGI
jgi:large subunit ribosomal protein L23